MIVLEVIILALAAPKQCTVQSAREFRDALTNADECNGIKTTDFFLSSASVKTMLLDRPVAPGRMLKSLVLSGTRLETGVMTWIGDAIETGLLNFVKNPRPPLDVHPIPQIGNNGLDSSEDESTEAVSSMISMIMSASNNNLVDLRFTDNILLDHGAAALGSALAGATSMIESLVLSGNGITPKGVFELCTSLAGASRLDALTITGVERGANSWMSNEVGFEGAVGVLEVIKRSNLKKLVLSGTNLRDRGASELTKGLKGNSILQFLDLHRNSISDVGAQNLADALKSATALRLVVLTTNKISDVGVAAIAAAVVGHPTLQLIDIGQNTKVSGAGRVLLDDALNGGDPSDIKSRADALGVRDRNEL